MKKTLLLVLISAMALFGCTQPASISPLQVTETPTNTPTITPTATPEPILSPTTTPIEVSELSALVLQPADVPDLNKSETLSGLVTDPKENWPDAPAYGEFLKKNGWLGNYRTVYQKTTEQTILGTKIDMPLKRIDVSLSAYSSPDIFPCSLDRAKKESQKNENLTAVDTGTLGDGSSLFKGIALNPEATKYGLDEYSSAKVYVGAIYKNNVWVNFAASGIGRTLSDEEVMGYLKTIEQRIEAKCPGCKTTYKDIDCNKLNEEGTRLLAAPTQSATTQESLDYTYSADLAIDFVQADWSEYSDKTTLTKIAYTLKNTGNGTITPSFDMAVTKDGTIVWQDTQSNLEQLNPNDAKKDQITSYASLPSHGVFELTLNLRNGKDVKVITSAKKEFQT